MNGDIEDKICGILNKIYGESGRAYEAAGRIVSLLMKEGQSLGSRIDLKKKLMAKVAVDGATSCWNWTGAKNEDGYGRIWDGKKIRKAHRVSFEIYRRAIPEGMVICHRCDNPACVNPDHLFLGTTADNVADMIAKGRQKLPVLRGSKHHQSKLTEEDVLAIRSATGVRGTALAQKYGVSELTISFIKTRRSWKHI